MSNNNTTKKNTALMVIIIVSAVIILVSAVLLLVLPNPNQAAPKDDVQLAQDDQYLLGEEAFAIENQNEIGNSEENQEQELDTKEKEDSKTEKSDVTDPVAQEEQDNALETADNTISDYVGYWGIKGSEGEELTIHSVNDKQLSFSLWYYRLSSIDGVIAEIEGNKATFSKQDIEGVLTFEDGAIKVEIQKSNIPYMSPSSMIYDDRREVSLSMGSSGISDGQYILPNSDRALVTESDLVGLSKEELRIARNEIYARYGRLFKDQALQNYFNSKEWYNGCFDSEVFSEDWLSEVERANIVTIKGFEDKLSE